MKVLSALIAAGLLFAGAPAAFAFDVTVEGKDGAAIQAAINKVAAAGGGRVTVPAGEYPSGSIRLRSDIELRLERGARLVGSLDHADYFSFPESVCSVKPENSSLVFLYAWDAENLAITGEGEIDGRGPEFFDRSKQVSWGNFWAKPEKPRPRMVQFVNCRKIRLEGVRFHDSPGWTMLIRRCEDILVKGIRVEADQRIINSDGIDFDCCRKVRVCDSSFRTGDDCLILRAMREGDERAVCEDVEVKNCELDSACQCIRIGCPSDDVIRNASFEHIRARGNNGIFFDYPPRYVRPSDEGHVLVYDLEFEDFRGEFTGSAVQIVVGPGVKIRGVKDISFEDFDVVSAKPLRFVGNADSALSEIKLEDFRATVKAEVAYEARATEPLEFENCVINGERLPDRKLVTPRGEREELVRSGVSWEGGKRK